MTNRTVQVWGQGYSLPPAGGLSLTPCTITATFNGTEVFSGAIPTIESSDIQRLPTDQQVLFTFEIPMDLQGTFPMSCTITGDDVFLEQILANYTAVGTDSSGPTEFGPINGSGDARSNVTCTGATYYTPEPTDPRPPEASGAWGYEIEVASGQSAVFSCDVAVVAGLE